MGKRVAAHAHRFDASYLGSDVGRNGQQFTGMPVIEAEGLLFEVFVHASGKDILKLQERRDDPPEPPQLEDPADLPLDVPDLVSLFRQKIGDPFWQGGVY